MPTWLAVAPGSPEERRRQMREPSANYRANEGPGEWLEQALSDLDAMTGRNWKAKRDAVAVLVRQAKDWYDGHVLREDAAAEA